MLDVVQANPLSGDFEQFVAPRSGARNALAHIHDAVVFRVAKDYVNRKRVVEVHPVSKLLPPTERSRIERANALQVIL